MQTTRASPAIATCVTASSGNRADCSSPKDGSSCGASSKTTADEPIASAQTLVVLEASNADNVGVVFRNAAAFGAGDRLLSPTCCDPLYRKAIRTSMGATLRVPFARTGTDDWPIVLTRVRAAGFTIAARAVRDAGGESLCGLSGDLAEA